MPLPAPSPTLTSRMLVGLMDWTGGWSRGRAMATSAALFVFVTSVDYCIGGAFNVNFLYLIACAFAVWCAGTRGGISLSLLGAIAAAVVKHYQLPKILGHPLPPMTEAWSVMSRILSFGLFVVIVNGLRGVLLQDRWHAAHDGLTGLLNKIGFAEETAKAITRAQGKQDNLLLALMDLDGFKKVNDTYGHSAGDRVLQTFAMEGSEVIRPTDLFARLGGDEFGVLLTVPRQVDAASIAEIVHQRFTTILAQTGFDVTCSMGATVVTGEGASTGGMMEEVDGLMYEVKRSGKNGLRLGRGTPLTRALRTAFPPLGCDDLSGLLQRIDLADRRQGWNVRSAA